MRENKAAVKDSMVACQELLREAAEHLKILDWELGDRELIIWVAAELAELREMAGRAQPPKLP